MLHDILSYAADGLSMRSHLYVDDAVTGARPGILVFPEGPGLGDHAKAKAQRLAGEGYAALACDLHGDESQLTGDDVMAQLGLLMQAPDKTRARARAAMEALTARPEVDGGRIAAIGFCFGGTMALELARSGAPIRAAVGFHSGLGTQAPQDAKNITARILVCLGADDPLITAESRIAFEQEMRGGGVDWRMHVYGGVVHSFTNPGADAAGQPALLRYDAGADARSWAEMIAVFAEVF